MENGTLIHLLDGDQVDEPRGWIDFTEELERNFEQRIVATQYPIEVTFHSGGYATLRELYLSGFCETVTYTVNFVCGSTFTVVRGSISVADIEWNLNKCEAKVKVQDDGYGARIFNNKDIKVFPTAEATKNGEAIEPVVHIDLEVYDPTEPEATYLTDTRKAYDWLECMEHCVGYITDGLLTVESDWYSALPEDERYCLVYGHELRVADGVSVAPQFSFTDLFANAWKKYNLWAYITRDLSGNPILKIEEDASTYTDTTAVSLPNQDDLVQSINTDLLYAKVEVGSDTYIKDEDGTYAMPFLTLQGFTKEEYHLEGTCNTDNNLDLVSSFIIDTNAIEDCAVNNNDEYDEDVFMIQYEPYTAKAVKGDYLIPGGPPFLYNEQLLNINVVNRWPLQASGVMHFDTDDVSFKATQYTNQHFFVPLDPQANTTYTSTEEQIKFSNDYDSGNFDPSNSWGNGTPQGNPVSEADSIYTAANTGFYQFEEPLIWAAYRVFNNPFGFDFTETIALTAKMIRYDSADVQVASQSVVFTHTNTGNSSLDLQTFYTDTAVFNTVLQAGDYVKFTFFFTYTVVGVVDLNTLSEILWSGCSVRTSFIASGGGTLVDTDPDEYRATRYEFKRYIPPSDWVNLRDDPTQQVQVATDDVEFRNMHALKVSRNIATGETEWECIANRDQTFK